jgi:signal transduction histidine kinase
MPLSRLRALPLRGKVLLTVLGTAIAVLGASTVLSFRFWRVETLETAERQALLAAGSTRATIESALRDGRREPARRTLVGLMEDGTIGSARVYGEGRIILLSADRFEEGDQASVIWIPQVSELPREGLVNRDAEGRNVRAFLPMMVPEPAVLEVEFSTESIKAAMDRGARLGLALVAVSLITVSIIVVTMFEREVVAPLHRMDDMLRVGNSDSDPRSGRDELKDLEAGVTLLIEKEAKAEARAADQEGLAKVGELAAEMAHEFKRPLTSVRTAVDVLQQEYTLDEEGSVLVRALDEQLERLHETMQDLFSIAKPIVPESVDVDLIDTLDEALMEVAGQPAMAGVQIQRAYAGKQAFVVGDARRLRQAFMNVVMNGAEAMPDGGTLVVDMEVVDHEARVSVADGGTGLEPHEVERVLKPFYSTKPSGTGLGLPLVARVVSAHRGRLAIESTPGEGTTVCITLPQLEKTEARGV